MENLYSPAFLILILNSPLFLENVYATISLLRFETKIEALNIGVLEFSSKTKPSAKT